LNSKIQTGNLSRVKPLHDEFVLSIKQPWAELIISGRKDVEVRSWATNYRGPLWIHTGKNPDSYAAKRFQLGELFMGGIIGYVELWGIRPLCAKSWEAWRSRHKDNAPFDEQLAKYGWILRNPKRLKEPVSVKGTTGIFKLPESVRNRLRIPPEARLSQDR